MHISLSILAQLDGAGARGATSLWSLGKASVAVFAASIYIYCLCCSEEGFTNQGWEPNVCGLLVGGVGPIY